MRQYSKWIIWIALLLLGGTYVLSLDMDFQNGKNTPAVATEQPLPDINIPKFSSDSAYVFTEKIVSFGPRVTGTPNAAKVRAWMVAKLKSYGAEVIEQKFSDKKYDGKPLACTNIIARINPTATKRILLAAHWDSRDVADQDTVRKNEPILGADDSGSSLGMLIEMARQLQATPLSNIGVDIVFFDAEDLGAPESENGWCIGSKYWSRNPHVPGYRANYGILLDMAGARNARFTLEQVSMRYAAPVMAKVWKVARQKLGYVNYFVNEPSKGPLTDDHVYVNEIARIPMIDIINHPEDTFFGTYWHTHKDDMSIIDKETLKAVGQTLLSVLHYEAANAF